MSTLLVSYIHLQKNGFFSKTFKVSISPIILFSSHTEINSLPLNLAVKISQRIKETSHGSSTRRKITHTIADFFSFWSPISLLQTEKFLHFSYTSPTTRPNPFSFGLLWGFPTPILYRVPRIFGLWAMVLNEGSHASVNRRKYAAAYRILV